MTRPADLPNSAAMVGAMTSWCRVAERGQQYIYHLGSLARDRRASGILNIVADTAMLLAETRFLRLQQERMVFSSPEDDRWVYLATRSGTGYAPRAVISLRISSFEWRALRAVRDREAGMSVTRAIRDAMVYPSLTSPDVARSMIALLQDRQLIKSVTGTGKNWELSPAGLEALT